tara:strand:- start:93 stop:290 length:198 start_codon:yes stop_codon:yes gene_type:complete
MISSGLLVGGVLLQMGLHLFSGPSISFWKGISRSTALFCSPKVVSGPNRPMGLHNLAGLQIIPDA